MAHEKIRQHEITLREMFLEAYLLAAFATYTYLSIYLYDMT